MPYLCSCAPLCTSLFYQCMRGRIKRRGKDCVQEETSRFNSARCDRTKEKKCCCVFIPIECLLSPCYQLFDPTTITAISDTKGNSKTRQPKRLLIDTGGKGYVIVQLEKYFFSILTAPVYYITDTY